MNIESYLSDVERTFIRIIIEIMRTVLASALP